MGEHFTTERFIAAIPGTGGIISDIAHKAGCNWNTVQNYIRRHPTVRRAYEEERERVLDIAEAEVLKSIRAGDMDTIKWYLLLKGQSRGYIRHQRQEITGADGGPLEHRYQIIQHIISQPDLRDSIEAQWRAEIQQRAAFNEGDVGGEEMDES